ncbi:hypothetical protein BCR32DRAFT_274630 [Anaeromyces robustus]|uniref:Uncharacterized protein n=1 Tax=Anaeromyces robustus TaxID=1754192 RepID=A0A1Y1XNL6_9FUNG|nr:hypothetical protein BCR32DRAFT_274630 [Anaeromyces robustus]|eukprot:ORX87322.1 hypothetical protein BCR32DRAFT_274630 [Anaeromyces robustus]
MYILAPKFNNLIKSYSEISVDCITLDNSYINSLLCSKKRFIIDYDFNYGVDDNDNKPNMFFLVINEYISSKIENNYEKMSYSTNFSSKIIIDIEYKKYFLEHQTSNYLSLFF